MPGPRVKGQPVDHPWPGCIFYRKKDVIGNNTRIGVRGLGLVVSNTSFVIKTIIYGALVYLDKLHRGLRFLENSVSGQVRYPSSAK